MNNSFFLFSGMVTFPTYFIKSHVRISTMVSFIHERIFDNLEHVLFKVLKIVPRWILFKCMQRNVHTIGFFSENQIDIKHESLQQENNRK